MSYSSSSVGTTSPRGAAAWLFGSVLVLGLFASGDRSVFSAAAANAGIDPLEILNLAVRPNAIFVLDSSGSMGETVAGVGGLADDDPDTKIAVAKNVIRNVISANQSKVSFQFGQYEQGASYIATFNDLNGNGVHDAGEPLNTQTSQSAGNTRFQYTAKNPTFATEPHIQLRLFEVPAGSNWTITFANGNTSYTTSSLPARVYTGTELAQQIATLMNAQDNSGYAGSFSDPATATNPVFTFTRSSGNLPFTMNFSLMNATLKGFLRAAAASGSYLGDTNDVTSPYSIQPNVGTFTSFTITNAPPNSFVIAGSPTIRIGRGGTNYTTTLANATYTGAQLAAHIATRMGVADTLTGPPDQFVISGTTTIQIRRNSVAYTGTLTNGTYTGAELANHIAGVMDAADPATLLVADYTGAYNAATGVFSFNRLGTDGTAFDIRWASSSVSLQGSVAASGGIRAPTTNASDTTSPFSLSTLGGMTATTLYSGTYNTATGVFTFHRSASVVTSFDILWSNWTASLLTLIGAPGANASDTTSPFDLLTNGLPPVSSTSLGSTATNTGPSNSTAPLVFYRRADSGTYDITDTGNRYLSAMANKLFNGQNLTVLADGTPCNLTAGTPVVSPAVPPITVQVVPSCGGAATTTVTFLLRGPTGIRGAGSSCGGYRTLVGLADCLDNDQLTSIDVPYLQNDLNFSGSSIAGYVETDGVGASATQPTQWGIRAAGNTPIAESLIDIRNIFISGIGAQPATPFVLPLPQVRAIWPVIAAQTRKQRTFVIFVTDGDDTCDNDTGGDLGYTADENALRAAHKAQQLYARYVAAEPESSVTTYLVAFGTGAAGNRANWIAWGGSGMIRPTTGSGAAQRWSAIPSATDRANCATCRDAFLATNANALSSALQSVIDQGQTAGEFSDQQSITETVFEYADLAPSPTPNPTIIPVVTPSPYNPLDPTTRFGTSIPVLLQSTFELPEFNGHLKAFVRGDNGTPNNTADDVSVNVWDAGAKLIQRVVTDTGAMGTTPTYTFAQLYGNATPTTVKTSTARIKRRIFSSSGQGVLTAYTAQNLLSDNALALQGSNGPGNLARVDLWPPSSLVAPSVATSPAPAGSLDDAMGLGASVTTLAQVQAVFPMACLASSDATPRNHPDCTSGTVSVVVARAKREAREAMLAYLAGAAVSNVSFAPNRLVTGEMLFVARPWIMSESTLAAPAVVTPPLSAPPLTYRQAEYILYRDGPRDATQLAKNGIRNGLGLRNPDLDGNTASRDDMALKPQMSVVYHATNQGLHALRGGPCPTTPISGGFGALGSLGCASETGGEELWAFVPFDQLGKLSSLMRVQSRSNKTYLLAAPVRITDVFVPGSASASIGGVNVSVGGVWRTLAVFGRGIAGKSMTALDVTVPGPFTWHSLDTRPPLVVWSRGNYDTNDGKVKTVSNSYAHDAADYTAYLGLGETWSVPAIARVDPATHVTNRGASAEFAMFMGSGYTDGTANNEGKTFFVADVLTGDIIRSFPLPDGTVVQPGLSLPNVVPASPAIYTVETTTGLSPSGLNYVTNPVEASAKVVYFGDLHSRIWRYSLATPTVAPTELANLSASGDGDQPFANGLAMLEYMKTPQVFTSGGRDSRVNLRASPPRFRMYGYSDGPSGNPVGPLTQLYARDFPQNYRGNSAPAAGFVSGASGVVPIVFYTGLSFAAGSDPAQPCLSRFDSVLFALQGLTGLAALDLNSTSSLESDDAYATIQGQVLQNPHITTEGTLVVDRGLGAQAAPPPPAPPVTQPLPPQSVTTTLVVPGLAPGSAAYNALRTTTTPWRAGTAVCNVNP